MLAAPLTLVVTGVAIILAYNPLYKIFIHL